MKDISSAQSESAHTQTLTCTCMHTYAQTKAYIQGVEVHKS